MSAIAGAPRATIRPEPDLSWLRRSWPIAWAHRGTFLPALLLSVLSLATSTALPRVTMDAIDRALYYRSAPLAPYLVALGGLGILLFAGSFLSRLLIFVTGYGIEYDLRAIIFEHLTRLSYSFHAGAQTGQLVSRANSDVRSVQSFLTFAPSIAITLFGAVFAFAVMLTVSVPLALVAVSTMPFVYVAGIRMRRLMFPLSWLVQARSADVATIVEENVAGVRVVKSFAAESRQLDQLARAAARLRWVTVSWVDVQARWAPVLQNLPSLSLALVLLFGGWLAIHGQLTIGALVAFNAYVLMMQAPFRMLGFIMAMGQVASASAQRIFEVLDTPVEIVDRPGAAEIVDVRGEVEFADVTFAYPDGAPVLDGFSLRIAPGETLALVGATATGKTTAARLLLRLYDPQAGAVLLDGTDVRDITQESLRRAVGLVPDEPFLFSVSVHDNIAFGRPDASRAEVRAAARAAAADEFIAQLPDGYDTVVGERGYTLSGGQRQRIALARALLSNPRVLVLDDATSAIDVKVEQQIHAGLRDALAGRTTLIIAHRLSTIGLADRVALVEGGRVIATGTHAHLLETEPSYARVLATVEEQDRLKAERAEAHLPELPVQDLRPLEIDS